MLFQIMNCVIEIIFYHITLPSFLPFITIPFFMKGKKKIKKSIWKIGTRYTGSNNRLVMPLDILGSTFVTITVSTGYYTLKVHIHWGSHARLHSFPGNPIMWYTYVYSIFSPYCDSIWLKLSQYGEKILYAYAYYIVGYLWNCEPLHEITDLVHEMLSVCAP